MRKDNRSNAFSADRAFCRRLAVLAGAAVMALTPSFAVWAEEADKGGDTMETAVIVPAFPDSLSDTESSSSSAPSTEEASSSGETTGTGTATRVIRTDSESESTSTSSDTTSGTSGIDYSLGPGYIDQQVTEVEDSEEESSSTIDVQIYDVTDSIVTPVEKYSYEQMVQDISALKTKYGSKLQVNVIGTSLDGREIYDCIVGDVNASSHILIQGGIHGREYLNPLLLMQQMEMALANYDTGSYDGNSLSSLFSQVAVHFVPMTNPDGVTISQFGLDMIRSESLKEILSTCYVMDTAAGRTTDETEEYFSKWKANAEGVDLNLNFDALWDEISSTEFASYSGYKGAAPGTEPETQALMNLYNNTSYNWKAVINYHSMGDVIYWDIAGNKVQEASSELATLMSETTGGYTLLASSGGGGYKDWIQLSSNPVPSVTLETGTVSCPMPLSEYSAIWEQNRLTWVVTMDWVLSR